MVDESSSESERVQPRAPLVFRASPQLTVKVWLLELNLFPHLRAVNHSFANDNEQFLSTSQFASTIIREYCPYPLPEYYTLNLITHEV